MPHVDEKGILRQEPRYYDVFMVMSTLASVCGNFLALKMTHVVWLTFGASVIFFPASYILGDLITGVYGFERARRVMWVGFGGMLFAAIMSSIVLALPAAPGIYSREVRQHYDAVVSVVPRAFLASILAFAVGSYVNDVAMSQRKVVDEGKGILESSRSFNSFGAGSPFARILPAGVWRSVAMASGLDGHGDSLLCKSRS